MNSHQYMRHFGRNSLSLFRSHKVKQLKPMCPQLKNLTVVVSLTDPVTGDSYDRDVVWDKEKGHHRLTFWDEQQVVQAGDTELVHLVIQRVVLGNSLRRTPPSVNQCRHSIPSSCHHWCRTPMSLHQRTDLQSLILVVMSPLPVVNEFDSNSHVPTSSG